MAVTVTDQRTIWNEADATTGWTGGGTVFTADPDPVEATGSLGVQVSTATVYQYHTGTAQNLQNTLLYVWVLPRGAMDTTANGGVMMLIGDGTNRGGFKVGGSDSSPFRHDTGPVPWSCMLIDTGNLPASPLTQAGTPANINYASITNLGAGFKTLAKSVGGVANCWVDIMRFGNGGLRITGGTSGGPGLFSEIAAVDRSTGNQQAYGIIRELASGAFGVQGPLTWGDTAGTAATYFADKNVTVVWEERGVRGGRYSCIVQGNATGSTTFQLGTKNGTGDTATGADGVTLAMTPLSVSSFTATDADLQFLLIYGSRLTGWRGGLSFSSNATNGPNHEFIGNTVVDCGNVVPGRVVFRNNVFQNFYTTTTTGTGSAYVTWDANTDMKGSSFTQGTPQATTHASHAIRITNTGTITFNNMNFSGYSTFERNSFQTTADVNGTTEVITLDNAHSQATNSTWPAFYQKRGGSAAIGLTDGTMYWLRATGASTVYVYDTKTNADTGGATGRQNLTASGSDTHWFEPGYAAVYNDSGGSVTINITGTGSVPTIRNSNTSSTTATLSVTLTLTGLVNNSEVRIIRNSDDTELAGTENVTGNQFQYSYNAVAGVFVRIHIHHLNYLWYQIPSLELPTSNSSIPIQQTLDRQYSNPA